MAAEPANMNHKLLTRMVEAELQMILDGKEQEFSYLVEGPHGIGKSAFWKQICLDHDGYFVDLRLGQRDLGDIIGLPTIVVDPNQDKHMVHIKPELVRKMFVRDLKDLGLMGDDSDKLRNDRSKDDLGKPYKFILGFLDEYNRGTKEVQQSVFELVYDRSMNGDRVHPKCLLAAACNDNIEIYTITESDPAFRSRFKTIKYCPTVDEWLSWGKKTGQLCEELIYTIEQKKELADPPKGKDMDFLNQPHPNRRSWHEFSKFYVNFKNSFNDNDMRDIGATFVGYEAAEVFKLMKSQMQSTKKQAATATNVELQKVDEIVTGFLKQHKMSPEIAKDKLKTFTPSDLQALQEEILKFLNNLNYMTGVSKERIFQISELLPEEIFSAIWKRITNTYDVRVRMGEYAVTLNRGDWFAKFE